MLSKFALLSLLCALFVVSEVRAQQANAAQSRRYSLEGEKALLETRATMYLDAECKMVNDPYREEQLLWQQLG